MALNCEHWKLDLVLKHFKVNNESKVRCNDVKTFSDLLSQEDQTLGVSEAKTDKNSLPVICLVKRTSPCYQ